jgi:small conductance mechanosensitive channel
VQTASLLAVLGAAGLAIGLALQGTLSNLAAGVMLLLFRPFKLDQVVDIGGKTGKVKGVRLFTTELATPDNVQIILPNAKVWGEAIVNFSHHETRRVDMVFGIAYGDPIDKAMEIIKAQVEADSRSHADPAPQIVVGELADSSVNIITRVWCDSGDYWDLKFDLTKSVKEAFDAAGISIPFPQTDVHLQQAAAA